MDGSAVIERLAERPGGRELLGVAAEREDLALVGGAVRDLMLARTPRELDVVVDAGSEQLAAGLLARLGGEACEAIVHERFGTAAVAWPGGRIDIAERRAESYARPGALPDVRAGSAAEDLARRDFTVNAVAVTLGGRRRGEVDAAARALEDLAAARLRVLHERSFIDDPTRLLRLCRYGSRLGFALETATARLAREAVAAGALDTVSRARIAAELSLICEEGSAGALAALGELGVLGALALPAPFDAALLEDASALAPRGAALDMAVLFHPAARAGAAERAAAGRLMDAFEFSAEMRERVLAAAFDSYALAEEIEHAQRPSQLRAALARRPVEAIALAGAIGGRRMPEIRERARVWLGELREVKLEIAGADLIAAGVPEGPEIGRRLERVLDRRLDGELAAGRGPELAAAMEA